MKKVITLVAALAVTIVSHADAFAQQAQQINISRSNSYSFNNSYGFGPGGSWTSGDSAWKNNRSVSGSHHGPQGHGAFNLSTSTGGQNRYATNTQMTPGGGWVNNSINNSSNFSRINNRGFNNTPYSNQTWDKSAWRGNVSNSASTLGQTPFGSTFGSHTFRNDPFGGG
jgi:hypothetical protein